MAKTRASATALGWRCLRTAVLAAIAMGGGIAPLHAAGVLNVSPQGEARDVRQVSVRFDADMVPLGQSDGDAPATLQCSPGTPAGKARWVGSRLWAFEFAQDVRGGVRCQVVFKPDLHTLAGERLTPAPTARFVAGPFGFFDAWPLAHQAVAPDQVFLLRHHDPQPTADAATLAAQFQCELRDEGGQVSSLPMVPASAAEAAAARKLAPPQTYAAALRCAGALPEDTQLKLRHERDADTAPVLFSYRTRESFRARLGCTLVEYPKGHSACDPRQGVNLSLSAPIPVETARQIQLTTDGRGAVELKGAEDGHKLGGVRHLYTDSQQAHFREGQRATLSLPADLRDALGRPLANAAEFPQTLRFARLPPYLGGVNSQAVMPWQPGRNGAAASFAVRNTEKRVPVRQWRLGGEMGPAIEAYAVELMQGQPSGQWPQEGLGTRAGPARQSELKTQGGAMEFVSVPLDAPGLHVVRADSALFSAYLDSLRLPHDPTPDTRPRQRYVTLQSTNLSPSASLSEAGASRIWVTALDSAQPVAGADVALYSCNRELLWRGQTDARGLADPGEALRGKLTCPPRQQERDWNRDTRNWLVVRAGQDMVVMAAGLGWSPQTTAWGAQPWRAHTVLDRTLFKAGETVHMQHLVRLLDSRGFALPAAAGLDVEVRFNGDKVAAFTTALGSDGSATSQWTLPLDAKLGRYSILLSQGGTQLGSTAFQVEEFRTPVFDSTLSARTRWERDTQSVQIDARVAYFAGGAAAGLPIEVRHGWLPQVTPPRAGYSFHDASDDPRLEAASPLPPIPSRPARLDAQGRTQVKLQAPALGRPMTLQTELKFEDPNGETQTVGASAMLWPDRLKLGLRMRAPDGRAPQAIEGIALDEQDQPVAGDAVRLSVKPVRVDWTNGSISYHDLAAETEVCSVRTDAQGKWRCEWQLPPAAQGQPVPEHWLFTATSASRQNSRAPVQTRMLQSRSALGWRAAAAAHELQIENGPSLAPGDTAQVLARPLRLPASLLLSTEREGVMDASVHALHALEQRIAVPLAAHHAPNVHLSARYVYPLQDAEPQQPLASTQRAALAVRPEAWRLAVNVRPQSNSARPRTQVPVEVAVRNAEGRPVDQARVTLVAVDQALLALWPNNTWTLASTMLARRGNSVVTTNLDSRWLRSVETGEKPLHRPYDEADRGASGAVSAASAMAPVAASKIAVPEDAPRSDLSSLILWRTDLRTDAQGIARVAVPLNDALTQFRIVAIVSAGADQFGEGETTLTSTQPLQIFSGLPELLRADDTLVQKLSLRNTGATALAVRLKAEAAIDADDTWLGGRAVVPADALAARGLRIERKLQLAPGQTQEVLWPVAVPDGAQTLRWRITADGGSERDALDITQRVVPALPVTVRQATLLSVAEAGALPVMQPRHALPLRGGVRVELQASLVDAALSESTRWMSRYPYGCLEQQSSRYATLNDRAAWDALMLQLPKYLDDQGMARYFPEASLPGSETLTMQLLDLAHAMNWPVPEASQHRMLNALDALLQGRIQEQDWAPDNDLEPRQLAAQATLAEHGRAQIQLRPRQLDALSAQSLVDWSRTLMAAPADAERDASLQLAGAQLRSRYEVQGTRLRWRDESAQHWWWFMWSGDSAAARMALLAQKWAETDAGWKADAPLITRALVGRQTGGRWSTTVGNVWSTVALRRFQRQFEAGPVEGVTRATLGRSAQTSAWTEGQAPTMSLPWPAQGAQATLQLQHEGGGKPWATVSVLAAVRNTEAVANGLVVKRTVTPVEQKRKGQWSVGDVYRVRLDLESTASQTWVVVRDAVPSGATQLGRGLGRESQLAQRGESSSSGWAWPSYVERATDSYRAYFRYVPRGKWSVEYTVRLNNAGDFKLPPVRAEAMYAPEIFAEGVGESMVVRP